MHSDEDVMASETAEGTNIEAVNRRKLFAGAAALLAGGWTLLGTAKVAKAAPVPGVVWKDIGSPEGVVTAEVGTLYEQTNAVNGKMLWCKRTGTGNTGWCLLQGSLDVVNVRDFGAKGDGTTNDTTAFQNAANAAAGKTLYIPPGTYVFKTSGGVSVPANTTVRGAGIGATILQRGTGHTAGSILQPSGDSVRFLDFTADGNGMFVTNTIGGEVGTAGRTNIAFQRIEVKNPSGLGIVAEGVGTKVLDCIVTGLNSATIGSFGIWYATAATTGVIIRGCTISRCRWSGVYGGGTGSVISGNYFFGNRVATGAQVTIQSGFASHQILGNYIGPGGSSTTEGIRLDGVTGVTITGNLIEEQGNYGIVLAGSTTQRITISGNVIRRTGKSPGGPDKNGIAIGPGVSGVSIIGNQIYDDQATPTQQWGILVQAGATDNYQIALNDLRGNVNISGLSDLGTGTNKHVFGNLPTNAPTTVSRVPFQWTGSTGATNLATAGTQYVIASGTAAPTADLGSSAQRVYPAVEVLNLFVALTDAPPGGATSRTFTVMKSGVATSAAVTISGASTSGAYTGAPVAFNAGDYLELRSTVSGVPALSRASWVVRLRETAP